MARSRRRTLGLGLLAACAAIAAGIVVHDVAKAPAAPTWETIFRPSALDERPREAQLVGGSVACGALPRRWIVIGWDGASWDLALPLVDAGRMPNLASLLRRGAHGNLYGFRPSLSPALWTTVATGVSPALHGIPGFDKRRHPLARRLERITHLGRLRRELYTNADRRRPALWNELSESGRRVLVSGYHNTYPAERVAGMMVSNFLVQAETSAVLRAGGERPAAGLVWPSERTAEVLALTRAIEARTTGELDRLAALEPGEAKALAAGPARLAPQDDRRAHFLRQAWLVDAVHMEVVRRFWPELEPDVALVHLQSLDWGAHWFLVFHEPDRFRAMDWSQAEREALAHEAPRYRGTLGALYERADAWLGELVAMAGDDTAILLLSDHGFEPEDDPQRGGQHTDAPPGILVLAGPGIVAGQRIEGATLYDLLPTLLAALGMARREDLPGRVLDEAFCPGARERLERSTIAAFEREDWTPDVVAAPEDLREDWVEELKSLGYLR